MCRSEIYRKENKRSSIADISMTYREETQNKERKKQGKNDLFCLIVLNLKG
jgi:hypothetical protein